MSVPCRYTLAKFFYTQVQSKQAFYLKFNFDSPGVFEFTIRKVHSKIKKPPPVALGW
jgi:hypothetical protein